MAVAANLLPVPAERLIAEWARVAPFVHALADGTGGRLTCADIVKAIQHTEMQLWAAERENVIGVMLTEVLNHPHLREAHLLGATGQNADEWIDLMPQVEFWAKHEGCKKIKATCRPGWKKLLRPIGFSETHCVVEKAL
jgi:hypothetical protein